MPAGIDYRDAAEKYLNFRPKNITVHERVDDFFSINRGDVVSLNGSHFLISGIGREKSFGLDEEPKHWVKYAYDLSTGQRKILKLIYHEQFDMKYGNYVVHCFRSPAKESLMLDSTKGNQCFMQGHTLFSDNAKGVRVIDYIKGKNLTDVIVDYSGSHKRYFRELLPKLLKMFLPCLYALEALHRSGIRHGDVRTDHLILDKETGHLRWIDFDYDFVFNEAPFAVDLLGVGNILSELVGKGERSTQNLQYDETLQEASAMLDEEDFSVVEPGRLMNWKKIYPYIPDGFNQILMHFCAGAEIYYETVAEIAEDLATAISLMDAVDDTA